MFYYLLYNNLPNLHHLRADFTLNCINIPYKFCSRKN